MIAGMNAYTLFHVLLSLVAILSGLVVLYGMFGSKRLPGWTQVFLWTTVATTVTGFGFPFNGFTPAIGTGIVSSVILAFTIVALYGKRLVGSWRRVYVISAVAALYLNVFVLIVQLFLKVPALNALAPQGKEPPFAITQGIALVLFIAAGFLAVKRFFPAGIVATTPAVSLQQRMP
jgi:hypothetical protein